MDVEKLVEAGARAICIEMGNNPDTDVGKGCALWECFTHEASSVLAIAFTAAAAAVYEHYDHSEEARKAALIPGAKR